MILHTLASNRLENSHEVLLRGRQDIASFLLLPSFLSWHFWLWKVVEVLQGAVKQLVQLSILGSHLAQVVRGSESNLINLLSLSPQAPSGQVGRLVLSWVPALPRHFCYVGPCRPPCTQNYIRPGCEISSSYTRGAPLPFHVPVVRKMARVTVTQRARPEDRDALFTGGRPRRQTTCFPTVFLKNDFYAGLQWNDPKTADVNLLLQDLSVVGTHRVRPTISLTLLDSCLGLHNILCCYASKISL